MAPTVADALLDLSRALAHPANTLDKASPNLLEPWRAVPLMRIQHWLDDTCRQNFRTHTLVNIDIQLTNIAHTELKTCGGDPLSVRLWPSEPLISGTKALWREIRWLSFCRPTAICGQDVAEGFWFYTEKISGNSARMIGSQVHLSYWGINYISETKMVFLLFGAIRWKFRLAAIFERSHQSFASICERSLLRSDHW